MDLAELTLLPLREKLQIMETLWAHPGSRIGESEVPRNTGPCWISGWRAIEPGESGICNRDDVKHASGGK